MKIFKIHYKIIYPNKTIKDHVFILKEESSEDAEAKFNNFIKDNLSHGDKIFGPISMTEIPDDILMIYSSYIV